MVGQITSPVNNCTCKLYDYKRRFNIVCQFLPPYLIINTEESNEADKKLYNEAMKDGHIDCKIIKVFIIGAAGVGKTTIKDLLFYKELSKDRVSTDVMEKPVGGMVRDVSTLSVGVDEKKTLFMIQNDAQLMTEVAKLIKSHNQTTVADIQGVAVENGHETKGNQCYLYTCTCVYMNMRISWKSGKCVIVIMFHVKKR